MTLVDFDEYIVPTVPEARFDLNPENRTLVGFLNQFEDKYLASFVFANAFHYLYWSNHTESIEKHWKGPSKFPYLISQAKPRRKEKPHAFGTRSKYVVKPEGVLMAGNHVVHRFVKGKNCNFFMQLLTNM